MPEPVELRVRGGERRGMAVAEPDDRDAGEEVEVALAVGVDEPRAVALDERDVEPRVGRQQLVPRLATWRHATTAVRPIVGGDAARRGERRGAQLRDDAAFERALGEHPPCVADADRVDDLVVDVEAGDVGEEDEAPSRRARARARPAASSAFTFSGPTASGATTGTLPRGSAASTLRRPARQRVADLAERRHRHGEQAVAVAEHRHGEVAERGAELGVDGLHRLADDLERRRATCAGGPARTRPGCRAAASPR